MLQLDIREPSLKVLVNGTPLDTVYEAEVQSNAYLGADRFAFRAAFESAGGIAWSQLPIQVQILFGINGTLQPIISGIADTLEIDPIRRDLCVQGRDMTSVFIGSQTHESFENQTSSDVASLLAARHGLAVDATPTTTLIGRYYQNGHTRSALSQHGRATTEWDVLSWLAQQEGFDVWTSGNTLYFQNQSSESGTITIVPRNCTNIHLRRDLAIGAGFAVQVQSWNCASQQAISVRANYGNVQPDSRNVITLRPNLLYGDAERLAIQTAQQLGSHERTVSYDAPADLTTMPRMNLQLTETNTDFDGMYVIYEVERYFSATHGFTQQVHARRSSWIVS